MIQQFATTLLFCCCISTNALFSQLNMSLVGQLSYPGIECNDIWGFVDSFGTEYALVGTTQGTSIVSLGDPSMPNELFFVPGPPSVWREIKTYQGFAYVTNETAGGLMIIDLRNLPASIDTARWQGSIFLETAHNIFIDEFGIAYTLGSNVAAGADFLDLNPDPWNPTPIGEYDLRYIHDCFVRGDTMYSAEINNGIFSVVDVSNKAFPIVRATQETPHRFSHHVWVSDDNKLLFNLDERSDAWVTAYDISDLSDIKETDRYKSSPGENVIPHNSFFLNNYLYISYYTDGAVVLDVSRPENLVKVGQFDSSPFSGSGFSGAWGIYPFLESGLIIVSDIEQGLFVLDQDLPRACFLEGKVSNESTMAPLDGVWAEIINQDQSQSNVLGDYKMGTADSGIYEVRFRHPECFSQTISGVELKNGLLTTLDVALDCPGLDTEPRFDEDGVFFELSPNLGGEVEISYFIKNFKGADLDIVDMSGRVVSTRALFTYQDKLALSHSLAAGQYLLRLRGADFSKTLRFVVQP